MADIYTTSSIDIDFPLGSPAGVNADLVGLLIPADVASVNITNWSANFAADLGLSAVYLYFKDKQALWDATRDGVVYTNWSGSASGMLFRASNTGGLPGLISRVLDVEYTMVDGTVNTQPITVNITRAAIPLSMVYSSNTIDFDFSDGSTATKNKTLSGLLAPAEIASVSITNWSAALAEDLGLSVLYLYFKSKRSAWNATIAGNVYSWTNPGSGLKGSIRGSGGVPGLISKVINVEYTLENGTVHAQNITVNVTRPQDNVTVPDLALKSIVFNESVSVPALNIQTFVSAAPESVSVADLALESRVYETVSVADLALEGVVSDPVSVADLALESRVLVVVPNLALSLHVYETVVPAFLPLITGVLDVGSAHLILVSRVGKAVIPDYVSVANLRLISIIQTPEPVIIPDLKLTSIVADGVFSFNPVTTFCGVSS